MLCIPIFQNLNIQFIASTHLKYAIMKTLVYLFSIVILVIAGCAKDDTITTAPIAMKIDCRAIPDNNSDLIPVAIPGYDVYYTYSRLNVSGAGSHIGKIDEEKSYYVINAAESFLAEDGLQYVRNSGHGKVVGENYDGFEFTFWSNESLNNFKIAGELEITPKTGTGIFKGSSGTLDILGSDANRLWLCIEGYLVFE